MLTLSFFVLTFCLGYVILVYMDRNKPWNCHICGQPVESIRAFVNHVRIHNITTHQYYDKYIKSVTEGICKKCGKPTQFINFGRGYRGYCSYECSSGVTNNTKSVRDKIKATLKERYGSENYVNIEESRKTKQERYGYDYFPDSSQFRKLTPEEESERVQQIKDTKLKRYGDENYCNIGKISQTKQTKYRDSKYNNKLKIRETWLNMSKEDKLVISNKIRNTKKVFLLKQLQAYITDNKLSLEIVDIKPNAYCLRCLQCQKEFEIQPQLIRKRYKEHRIICTHCNPLDKPVSGLEKDLLEFIRKQYDGAVTENDKSVIEGYELDIYLPDLKLAFEFNGLYWHNELYKPIDYHIAKTDACESKGIHLIHIFEDDWNYKQEIVKSRIFNLLGKSDRIYARECELKEVDFNIAKEFINNNHLQQFAISSIYLGLFYRKELVSIMTFGFPRINVGGKHEDGSYELIRFCSKLNTVIVGGADRLFTHFVRKYNPKKVISYADRCWTSKINPSVYSNMEFTLVGVSEPSYCYIVDGVRMNRFNFRKDVLVREGYDASKSEHEIMLDREIYRIYDCGQLKFEWT